MAAKKIKDEFPEFEELHKTIEKYEGRGDREAKFIYALDKKEPLLSIYLDKGATWKKNKVDLKTLETRKAPGVANDLVVEEIFKELLTCLKNEEKDLFNSL